MEGFKLLALYSLLSYFTSICFTLDMITPSQPIQDGKNETLVSSGGTFEAGFFSLENSTSRFVGIWYKNISPRTLVWVANKEKPLSDSSGILKVESETGILSILDSRGTAIWSSSATATQNKPIGLTEKPIVQLLESGNLVVKDEHNLKNILWQSIDYPRDTSFPEMKLDHSEGKNNSNSNKKKLIGNVVGCTVFIIVITVLGLTICIQKKKLAQPGEFIRVSGIVEILPWRYKSGKEHIDLPIFDFSIITVATDHFSQSNKLGQGGFGPVYKGVLADKQEIAVKRLSSTSAQGNEEFKNEVMLITKLQHRNLVKLLGCSIHQHEKLLIYEFMPNRSLDYFIFDSTRRKILNWSKRIQIINGIARGLLYLHQDSRLKIIHRDLKSSNILLDNDMNPKISDFGLARTFGGDQTEANTSRVMGTYGYIPPEYAMHGSFSDKSDIFSFGVIVLEVISGKQNRGFSDPCCRLNLIGHAWRLWNEGRPMELIDDLLNDSVTAKPSEILRCLHVGLLCVQQRPENRPDMSSMVLMLNGEKLLPEPSQPGFYTGIDYPTLPGSSSGTREEHSLNESFITVLEAR